MTNDNFHPSAFILPPASLPVVTGLPTVPLARPQVSLPMPLPHFPSGNKRKSPNHRRANELHASGFRTSIKKLKKGSATSLCPSVSLSLRHVVSLSSCPLVLPPIPTPSRASLISQTEAHPKP